MASAFAKKLGRIALYVPTPDASICLLLIYNILKRHRQARHLLQKSPKNGIALLLLAFLFILKNNIFIAQPTSLLLIGQTGFEVDYSKKIEETNGYDSFDFSQTEIQKCNAENSSLWEIEQLSHHWIPSLSNLTKIFSGDIDSQEVPSLEKFLIRDYDSIIQQELKKSSSQTVALEYKPRETDDFELFWDLTLKSTE